MESLVAVLEAPQKKHEQSNNIFDEPAREVYTEDSIRRFSTSSYMNDNIPYHDMMDIIKQIDEQMKISNNELNEWSSAKYIADANIKGLFRKLKELDTGEITTGVAESGYNETGVWEHYKKYIKKNELLYKEKTGQTITPFDIYEFTRLSAMADLIDVYGDSVYITKNEHLIQSKISKNLGVNVQILENNDILFIDKNVIWKYVGEDTYEASRNLVHGGYGARSVEVLKKLNESSSATALGHAVQNRSLDLTVEDLQFLYSMDPYGAKEYVTGIPGYTQKEKEHKKELREELYKLLTGEEIQYYKHKWSNWEKTDNPEGDIWSTVKSNADFALEVNDGIPDDLSVVKPITYTAAAFYGLNTLGVFLEGVSIYGFRMASGLAANGMLKEMIADYNSTLGATDADEQFIIETLNSINKDEELLEGTSKVVDNLDGLYGFNKGITGKEIQNINKEFGGAIELNGSINTVLESASRYNGFWNKTAAITRSIVKNHTFDNGNKRTALAVIETLMKRNGISTGVNHAGIREVIYQISIGTLKEVDEIAKALRGF